MKKNAFTLIELLTVIIIIGLLAVLIIPKVNKTLKDSRQKVNETSTKGLLRIADNYYLEQKIKGNFQGCEYDFENNINTCEELEFTGDKPEIGSLNIDKKGNVGIAVKYDDICYIKKYHSNEFAEIKNNQMECNKTAYSTPQVVTSGDGLYQSQTDEGRLIYRGTNPNNYITLKENNVDTTYRIISYETDGTIKVIRNDSIGNIPFDTETNRKNTESGYYCNSQYGCNIWGNQSNTYYKDKTLSELNQDFYFYYYLTNSSNNLSMKPNNHFGTVTQDSTLNTKLNTEFYETLNFKNKIATHAFYVGGIYYYAEYFENGYTGGDKGLLKEKQEEQIYTWKGKIALMNVTEFVESSLSSTCTSVYSNYYYNPNNITQDPEDDSKYISNYESGKWPCALQNWNYKNYSQWFLSAYSYNSGYVWNVRSPGNFGDYGAYNTDFEVRPVLYLNSDVILSGNGTTSNPYKIENL